MGAGSLGKQTRATPALSALITDLDGVLIDTETVFFRAVNVLLTEEGLPAVDRAGLMAFVGLDNDSIWGTLCARHGLRLALATYTARVDMLATAVAEREMVAVPGAARLLAQARARGVPVALASSADRARVEHRLRLVGLADGFDAIVTRDEVATPKPAPEVYLAAAAALGVPPAATLALEDAPVGIRAARRAGCYTVAVRTAWTAGLDLTEAHRVLNSLEEVDLGALGFGVAAPE